MHSRVNKQNMRLTWVKVAFFCALIFVRIAPTNQIFCVQPRIYFVQLIRICRVDPVNTTRSLCFVVGLKDSLLIFCLGQEQIAMWLKGNPILLVLFVLLNYSVDTTLQLGLFVSICSDATRSGSIIQNKVGRILAHENIFGKTKLMTNSASTQQGRTIFVGSISFNDHDLISQTLTRKMNRRCEADDTATTNNNSSTRQGR